MSTLLRQFMFFLFLGGFIPVSGLMAGQQLPLPTGTLTGSQIESLFSGKTVVADSPDGKNQESVIYFANDGKVRQTEKGFLIQGKWRIREDDRLCIDLKGEEKDCRIIVKAPEGYRQYAVKLDGQHRHELTYVDFKPGNHLAQMSAYPILPVGTLDEKQVKELFSGKTVESVSARKSRTSLTYYDPGGTVEQVRQGQERYGFWRVTPNGRICLQMENFAEKCRIIVKEGGEYKKYIVKKNGRHQHSVSYRKFMDGKHL